jgi:hypothetical protein
MCVPVRIREQQRTHHPAQEHRHRHTEYRHKQRRNPGLQHLTHGGFQPYFEQKEQDPQLGECPDVSVAGENFEEGCAKKIHVAEQDADGQLAQHGGLAHFHGQNTANFCAQQNNGQAHKDRQHFCRVGARHQHGTERYERYAYNSFVNRSSVNEAPRDAKIKKLSETM